MDILFIEGVFKLIGKTGCGCLSVFLVIFVGLIFLGIVGSFIDTDNIDQSSKPKRIDYKAPVRKETAEKWFEGGNLHKATISQWKKATYRNKLATAGDWLAATKWKGHINSMDDFNRLKVKAAVLVNAIDGSIKVDEIDEIESMVISEIVTLIIISSYGLGP